MPIYMYEREDGTTFDIMQKMSEDALTVCPETGLPVKRVICAPTPIFRGSGFYQTDYGTGSSAPSSSAPKSSAETSSSASDSGSGSNTTTEAKPAKCGSSCGCH